MSVKPPFSRREIGIQGWIQNDFPVTARMALLHLLYDLVNKRYVESWIELDREIRRIARQQPLLYDSSGSIEEARESSEQLLKTLQWTKICDFCERIHSHLAFEVSSWDSYHEELEMKLPREEVQKYIADGLERIFLEENLALSFDQGEVRRRGRSHSIKQIAKAESTLGDPKLTDARQHYAKAVKYFKKHLIQILKTQ